MTVKELIKILEEVEDQDRIVVLSRDPEGNGYAPLGNYNCIDDTRCYDEDGDWGGSIGYTELTEELEQEGYGEEDIVDGVPAIVFWPNR